jgi:hypothetical protein
MPSSKNATILVDALPSFRARQETILAFIPKWFNNLRVCRVSSQATIPTDFNTSTALKVISPRWPIGVATTYKIATGEVYPDGG